MDWLLFYDLIGGLSLLLAGIFWIAFGFFSMRKIEKGIVSEGKPRPCQWDPLWGRVIFYAWSVSLPARLLGEMENQILSTDDVKRYSNKMDIVLAWILMVSAHTMLLAIVVGWIFDLY